MRLALSLAQHWLALPRTACRTESSTQWVPLSDGTRLATHVVRPVAAGSSAPPTVLWRTAHPLDTAPARLLTQLVAGQGYTVVVQSCRGRWGSEGHFTPFADEARDGAEVMAWLERQPWFGGRLALAGFGYAGYAAWAACSRAERAPAALVVGLAGRDPHRWLYAGGALQLELALGLGVGIGVAAALPARHLDLLRAARHRPLCEADRVAARQTDWFREWIEHAERDAYWEVLCPPLPPQPPPALLIAGCHHPALGAQLHDHAELCAATRGNGAPELVLGPWGAAAPVRAQRPRSGARRADVVRAVLDFLDRRLLGAPRSGAPVRVYVRGAEVWREAPHWPLPAAEEIVYHLRSDGGANASDGDGRLDRAPAQKDLPDRFVYDPADAVPSLGGAALLPPGGPVDQQPVECRGDVLCYTSQPLTADLELAGPARVVLFAASDAPDTDFTAKLVEVTEDGAAFSVCEGIVRCSRRRGRGRVWLEPGRIERLEIDLWATGCRVRAGRCLRLEISSSNFPRFDRNANTREEPALVGEAEIAPARQTVYHDSEHPSCLVLHALTF
ncbi:MAG TPA: CocE/NonD family hydrolase [Myxococcota bacterium]